MSTKLQQNLQELSRNVRENSPKVTAKVTLSKGTTPDRAIAASVGKYFDALQRLSRE
jgi:hypothetical protein